MTYYTSDTESESELMVDDEIYDDDCDFLDADKEDRKYYIGISANVPSQDCAILLSSVSPAVFMRYEPDAILRYLVNYSATERVADDTKIQILKVHVDDRQTYTVVDKTFWLKFVQRSWKRVYAERQQAINARKNPLVLLNLYKNGKWNNRLPSVRGMCMKTHS